MSIIKTDCVHDNEATYLPGGPETAIEGECPICAAHRDPVTGEELFNAETVAAIEEGRAMMRGEIPSKLYSSADEMWEDLMKDDDD